MSGPSRLFVYGTLMQGHDNDAARRFHQEAVYMERGTIPGRLYHIGEYPGAIYDSSNRSEQIQGEIWRMKDPASTLSWLDEYEEFGAQFPAPNEFIRRVLAVQPEEGYHLACYVYLYDRFTDGRAVISDGDWRRVHQG